LEEKLEYIVGIWLRHKGLKLTVAESCTGGLIGDRITDIPGSSDYYLGSVTAYAYQAKERMLGVNHETLTRYGAVSRETAIEMAAGVRRNLGADYPQDTVLGVSVTGIAGPGGGLPEKPVGLVWIGMSAPDGNRAWRFVWNGDRRENKVLSAQEALQILLEYLQGKLRPQNG